MLTTIIYDMNGVIIDDEPLHELAFQKTCLKYNINLDHQDYKNLCMGKTDKEGFENIIKKFHRQKRTLHNTGYLANK